MSERDWPESLRINAASVSLGVALYDAARTAYAPAMPPFTSLSAATRRDYILAAENVIKQLKPPHGLTQMKAGRP